MSPEPFLTMQVRSCRDLLVARHRARQIAQLLRFPPRDIICIAAGTFVPEAYPLLTRLLDGIVERVAPPFVLSEIEGDAVFAFALDHDLELRGASVLACLADCYEAYRARLEAARDLMICACDACSSISGLELKFIMHHGDYVVQSIAGHQKLLGPDVTAAHLLLKNHVRDVIGRSAYALLTESAATHLEVPLKHAAAP